MERFPIQVVTAWMGNTPTIALKHYLQVTDQHFQAASEGGADAVQNPMQQPSEDARNVWQGEIAADGANPENPEKYQSIPECATPRYDLVSSPIVYPSDGEGFEPPVGFHPLQFSRLPQ